MVGHPCIYHGNDAHVVGHFRLQFLSGELDNVHVRPDGAQLGHNAIGEFRGDGVRLQNHRDAEHREYRGQAGGDILDARGFQRQQHGERGRVVDHVHQDVPVPGVRVRLHVDDIYLGVSNLQIADLGDIAARVVVRALLPRADRAQFQIDAHGLFGDVGVNRFQHVVQFRDARHAVAHGRVVRVDYVEYLVDGHVQTVTGQVAPEDQPIFAVHVDHVVVVHEQRFAGAARPHGLLDELHLFHLISVLLVGVQRRLVAGTGLAVRAQQAGVKNAFHFFHAYHVVRRRHE